MTPIANARRDLFEAMTQIAETGYGPKEHFLPWAVPSSGSTKLVVNHVGLSDRVLAKLRDPIEGLLE